MPKTSAHKQKAVFGDINITPLTDIFLVLLTIMIVVAPFMRQIRADIKLPDVVSGADVGKNVVTVDVTRDGKILVNDVEVAPDRLNMVLKDKAASLMTRRLVVQADKEAKCRAVLDVFRAAEDAQFDQMTVLGTAANPAQEKKPDEASSPGTVQ